MRILFRLLGFLKKYARRVVLAYLCLLMATGFGLVTPWLIREVIDVGLSRGDQSFLVLLALAVIGVSLLRGGFSYGQSYLAEYLSQRVAYDLRNALYDRFQRLSFAYHDRAQTGQLMSRATADVEAVRMFISMGSLRAIYFLTLFLATCVILFATDWSLALISLSILPLMGYQAFRVGQRLRPIWMGIQASMAGLGTILQENLSGIRVVKAFVQEEREITKFEMGVREILDLNLKANREQAFNIPLMSFLLTASTGLILWYGGLEVMRGQLTLGELVAFNSYLFMLAMPVRTLGYMVAMFSRAISAGERIFEVLDAEAEVKDRPGAGPLRHTRGQVAFEHVSFTYDSMSPVLKDVSFVAQPGEVIALLGTTGSGKSTIINLIPRFYDVSAGRITIDGVDIRDVTLASLRRNVAVVFQDTFLFSATVRENIAYGAPGATLADIVAAAKTAHIHDFIQSLPHGYETWVGERGVTLSGGQRQRLAIARTLLMNPRILILDDSTSSVDIETEYLIQQALRELMQGRTTFIITQRLQAIKDADQILALHEGEVVERGRHGELLRNNGMYRQIYDLQLKEQENERMEQEPQWASRR